MKDIERVCDKYEVKLRQSEREIRGCTGLRRAYARRGLSQDYPGEEALKRQVARYRAALIHAQEFVVATRAILDLEGVSTITRGYYLAFARSLDKLKRHGLSGETLAIEAAILTGTWVARGLSQSVLETIRTQVFDVGEPQP